jgi:hypothetical protein
MQALPMLIIDWGDLREFCEGGMYKSHHGGGQACARSSTLLSIR